MVRAQQHNISGYTADNIIQDVAGLTSGNLLADPRIASNTQFQREFRKSMGIQKSTTVMYRNKDESVAKMPLVQAYAQKRKINDVNILLFIVILNLILYFFEIFTKCIL